MTTAKLTTLRIPLYLLCRDRLESLRAMVDWFRNAEGLGPLFIMDYGSTYPPLLDYYQEIAAQGARIVRTNSDGPSGTFFGNRLYELCPAPFYAVGDCDTVPTEDCPKDLLLHLAAGLLELPVSKAGPSLLIHDLPAHYQYRTYVLRAEAGYWETLVAPGWYRALIDTTLSVRMWGRETTPQCDAVRSAPPYAMRHVPWYLDLSALPPDELYYVQHAAHAAHSYLSTMRTIGTTPEEVESLRRTQPELWRDAERGGRFEYAPGVRDLAEGE